MNISSRLLAPFFIVFICLSLIIIACWKLLPQYNIDGYVLFFANVYFLLICLLVFFIQKKALGNANPNVFIRSVMSGMMIKMVLCVAAVLAYTLLIKEDFNKKAVFLSLFFYLVYLAAEVKALMKLNKQHNA
jgi:hypothetical protein